MRRRGTTLDATSSPEAQSTLTNADISKASLCHCVGLRLDFGKSRVLDECSLHVNRGQIVGLTGENGSGKSTLVKCLLGFQKPTAGEVACHPRAGYCPQENYLHRSYTVSEHLALVASLRRGGEALNEAYARRCVDTLKLDRYMDYPIRKLSGGTYQKLKFLTAILHRPPLMILDEPTDGFDWTMYLVFWDLLRELARAGTGVLMISHLLLDRERFDRIYDLREGKLSE